MPTMRPCASAQIISSGNSMSFIQKLQRPSVSKTKSIPVPPGRSDLPESPWLRSASVSATSTAIVVEPIVTVCIGEFSRERTTKATPTAQAISTTIKIFFTMILIKVYRNYWLSTKFTRSGLRCQSRSQLKVRMR